MHPPMRQTCYIGSCAGMLQCKGRSHGKMYSRVNPASHAAVKATQDGSNSHNESVPEVGLLVDSTREERAADKSTAPTNAKQVATGGPLVLVSRPLPSVCIIHTGGTLGMDSAQSFVTDVTDPHTGPPELRHGTGGHYGGLKPGATVALLQALASPDLTDKSLIGDPEAFTSQHQNRRVVLIDELPPHIVQLGGHSSQPVMLFVEGQQLHSLLRVVPELKQFAHLDLRVAFNKDSCRVGPKEWTLLAKLLDSQRNNYDAFLVVHGTDTMAFTAAALSFMLVGFKKPIVLTGSQLPLLNPRTDARTNLLDAITCATAYFSPPHIHLQEVAICFGGQLLRGNRAQKVDSMVYRAFASPSYPPLASLGVDIQWNVKGLLQVDGPYRPRFKLDTRVIRIPIVPGVDPRQAYGDVTARGVRGVVLEAFGVGNMPDMPQQGWLPWLRQQRKKGLMVYLASQCLTGPLHPELYKSGTVALDLGVEAGGSLSCAMCSVVSDNRADTVHAVQVYRPRMTPECAAVKMMQCLAYPDIPLGLPLCGEM